MLTRIKNLLAKWLGLNEMQRRIDGLDHDLSRQRMELHDQIKMVGIDIHQRNRRGNGVQTEIIFVSHLGPEKGMGSVRIVDAEFRDYRELMEYIKHVAAQTKQRPAIIDGPMGMGRELKKFLDW